MEDNKANELQALKEELLTLIEALKANSEALNCTQMERILKALGAISLIREFIDAHTLDIRALLQRLERLERIIGGSGSVGMGQTVDPQDPKDPKSPDTQAQAAAPAEEAPMGDYQAKSMDQVQNRIDQIRNNSLNQVHRATFPPGSRPLG
jgi:hypothetical protein